jgi:hypothetical protein
MADFSGPRFEPGGLGRHHRLVGLMRSQGGRTYFARSASGAARCAWPTVECLAIAENGFAHLQAASAGRGRVERLSIHRQLRDAALCWRRARIASDDCRASRLADSGVPAGGRNRADLARHAATRPTLKILVTCTALYAPTVVGRRVEKHSNGMPPNLLAHYFYLWEPTVVRQAIETA